MEPLDELIRAERATVIFFGSLAVDGYRMPNGEFRVGLAGASRVLGYNSNWLSQSLRESPRTVRALQGLGFSQNIQKVLGESNRQNLYQDRTISLDDFSCCIIYAVQAKKKAAIALNKAFTVLSLLDFFRDAFGEPRLTIDEKRRIFYEIYASTISPEKWREMDQEEIINLALPGDEPQLLDGFWNQ